MKLNNNQIKSIRAVESMLIKSLEIDLSNTFHLSRMLNSGQVIAALKDSSKRAFNWSLYVEFIRPIYLYLEYVNNYLSLSKMSQHRDTNEDLLYETIQKGKAVVNALNKTKFFIR